MGVQGHGAVIHGALFNLLSEYGSWRDRRVKPLVGRFTTKITCATRGFTCLFTRPAWTHLRNGHPYAQLVAGLFAIGTTTAYRYITEAVDLLAALAPTLEQAVREASTRRPRLSKNPLLGGQGLSGRWTAVRVPYRGRWETLSEGQQTVNRSQAKIRAPVEPAIATLKT